VKDKKYLNGPNSIYLSVRTDNVTVNFRKSASLLRLVFKKQKLGLPAETTLPPKSRSAMHDTFQHHGTQGTILVPLPGDVMVMGL
jgi:hypothetical protein